VAELDGECAARVGARFFYRYGCDVGSGYIVVDGFPDTASFVIWYANAEVAKKDGRFVEGGEPVRVKMRLCADEATAIAVLALDKIAGRFYIFDGFGQSEKALGYEVFADNVYEWAYYYLADEKKAEVAARLAKMCVQPFSTWRQ